MRDASSISLEEDIKNDTFSYNDYDTKENHSNYKRHEKPNNYEEDEDYEFEDTDNKDMEERYDESYHNQEQDRGDNDDTKEEMAKELRENNDKICEYICNLKKQREELTYIIEKQYEERKKLETEMERITYKLCLINKSMAQRIKAKNMYDETLQEVETNYCKLVKDSSVILTLIKDQYDKLDGLINKTTNTDEKKSLKERSQNKQKRCNCHIKKEKVSKNQANKHYNNQRDHSD